MAEEYKDNRGKLFNALQGKYNDLGNWDEFNAKMDDEGSRKKLWSKLNQDKAFNDLGDWDTFNQRTAQSKSAPVQEVNNTFTETELQKQKVNDNSPTASKPANTSKSNINPRAPIQLDNEAKKKLEGAMSPVATSDTTSSPSEARRKEAELTQRTENLNAANPDKKQLSVRHKTTPAQGNEGPQTEQRLLNDEEVARQSLSEIMFNKEVDASASDIATSIAQERNLAQNIFDIAKQSGIDVFKQVSELPNNPNAGYANLMRNTRISNEQREKITKDLSASLAANIQHLLFPQYASRITKEAERLGIDFSQYAQYVGRVLLDNVQGELSQRLIDEGVPQNDVDYILYNLKNSITGVIASAATQTPEQFTADRMALEQYKEQKNPSFWTNLTAEAAKFVADTPYFMLGGEVGSATGRALMEREISTLIKRYGVERATAERILNTALKKSPALNIAQNTATRVAHSGATLGAYNVMSTAAQQMGTQEFDPFEILKSGLEGEMMGTIIGLPSGVIGTLANETSGLKRVLLDLAGFSAEVGAFTSADQFLNYLSGGDEKPWGDAFAESFGQVLAMRLGSPATYARTFKILTDPKAAYNTPYERMQLTKSERAELDKYYGTYFDDLEKWDSSRSGSEENKPLEDRMREFYNDVEQDSRISWGTRAKLAVVAGDYNQLYTPVLAGYGSDWSSQTGKGVITTYDSRGRKIEEETFSNKKKYDERVSNINNALAEYRLNQIQDRDDLDPRFMDKARASLSGLGEEGLNDAERRIWEAWTAKQEYDDAAADENTSKETLKELENRKNQAIAQLNPNDMELLGNWANEVVRYRAAIAEADNLVNGSNTRGYAQSDPQSLVQNNIAVMVANNGAKQNLTEEIRQQLDSDPITTLADLKIASDEADERTEEGKKAKNTYKFAEQYVRYKSVQQGMEEAQTDRVNAAVEDNNRQIDAVTSKGVPDSKINPQAGYVIPVRLKGDNEEYHVVGGNVFSTSDGSIDIVRSSGLINVIDRNGNVSCISPDDIASVGQAQSADLMKQQQGYSIRQQMQQQYQNAINGIVDFNAGDTYTLMGGDGKPFRVTVVGDAVDKDGQPIEGQVVVRTADGKETTMSRQDIQNMKSDADVHLVTDRNFQNEVEKLDNPPAETAPATETPTTEAPTNEENPTTEPATYATGDKITLKVGDDEVKGRVDSVDGDNVSFTTVKKVQFEGEEEASNTHTLPADALSGYITEHTPAEPAPEAPAEPAPAPETPAGPPTILQQITDKDGNIQWESVAPAQTLAALVEQAKGNKEIALEVAEGMAESAKKAVATAKGKVTRTRNEVEKAIADAQGVLNIAIEQANERVKGNDPVKMIEEREARNKAVTDAQDALKKAQEDGDRAIKEAEDGVVEAQRKADHWDEVLKVARGEGETPPATGTNPPTGGENPPTEVKLEDNPAFQQFSNALTERIKSIKAPIVLVGSREEMLDIAKREGIGQLTEDNVDDVNAFVVGKGENAKIYFYMPNLFERGGSTVEGAMLEAWRKIRHEADVHFGLREMLGNDGFNTILNRAYKGMSDDLRANFLKYNWDNNLSSRQKAALLKQADTEAKAGKAKWDELSDEDRNKLLALGDTKLTQGAAEEYIAHLAEKIKEGQKLTVEEKDLWDRILAWLQDVFGGGLTEEELTDLVLLSHEKLEKPAEGGGEPPAGGETPPTGGGTPPTGGGETPAGGGEGPRWEDTQIGRRYTNQKKRHPEGLMLLDMDDHYELYGEDALNAAKALKIQATENEFGIPYLSIDKRGADDKITDLVRAGYKINKSPLEGSEPEPEHVETPEEKEARQKREAVDDALNEMEKATTMRTRLRLRNLLKKFEEDVSNGSLLPTMAQLRQVNEYRRTAYTPARDDLAGWEKLLDKDGYIDFEDFVYRYLARAKHILAWNDPLDHNKVEVGIRGVKSSLGYRGGTGKTSDVSSLSTMWKPYEKGGMTTDGLGEMLAQMYDEYRYGPFRDQNKAMYDEETDSMEARDLVEEALSMGSREAMMEHAASRHKLEWDAIEDQMDQMENDFVTRAKGQAEESGLPIVPYIGRGELESALRDITDPKLRSSIEKDMQEGNPIYGFTNDGKYYIDLDDVFETGAVGDISGAVDAVIREKRQAGENVREWERLKEQVKDVNFEEPTENRAPEDETTTGGGAPDEDMPFAQRDDDDYVPFSIDNAEAERRRKAGEKAVEALKKKGVDVVMDTNEMERVLQEAQDEAQKLFTGEKGAQAYDSRNMFADRVDNLNVAKEMAKQGKSASSIKMATGWERGADGLWRYETPNYRARDGFFNQVYTDELGQKEFPLSDILKGADELFEAYPELRDVRVRIHPRANGIGGSYSNTSKTIYLNSKYYTAPSGATGRRLVSASRESEGARALMHEVQHAIQFIEGFAEGGSSRAGAIKRSLTQAERDELSNRLYEIEERLGEIPTEIAELIREARSNGPNNTSVSDYGTLRNEEDDLRREKDVIERQLSEDRVGAKRNVYRQLAGEVEARNVERRRAMTIPERRQSLAEATEDVDRKDQIILQNGLMYGTDGTEYTATSVPPYYFKTPEGEIYGFAYNGKIYLDPSVLDGNTPVHEYTHLWDSTIQKSDPTLWKNGIELMKQTPLWDEVKGMEQYRDIADDENLLASEVHARLAGPRAAEYFEQLVRDAEDTKGIVEKAQKYSLIDQLREWLNNAMKWVKESVFGNKDMTLEEFSDMPLRDLLSEGSTPEERGNDVRFSIGDANDVEVEPVEVTDDKGRKSLVGIHNMTLRNIEGAMGLGGVANPSTAVVDIDRVGHRHFGAYSLVAPSNLIEDITTNNGFARAGDAYSVNFPKLTNRDGKTYIAGTDIEANLKNISDYMNSVAQAQGRSAGIAQGSFLAPILKELNSLDDMRQQRDRLSENYDHDLAEFNAKWRSVKVPLIDKLGGDEGYSVGADRFVEVIQQADPKQFAKDNYDINLTDADVKDLQDYIRAVQEDMPVRYFEAKSNRPLYFNEFAGAVIPDDAPQNVVDFLENQGLDVLKYEAGDESDRLEKVRELADERDDVRFSMGRNEEAERTLTQVGGQKQPDTNYDTSELDDVRFSIGKRKMAEMDKRLAKARPDMTDEQRQALYDYLDTLGSTARQNATFHWFAKGTIRLPEDQYKVDDALSVASKVKDDPLSSNSPLEFMAKYPSTKPTRKPINPDTVPTLTNKKDYGDGVTVYDVDEGEESRKNMRAIIDTHWGDKANPWCLLEKDPNTGKLTPDSRNRWCGTYARFGKKVAFKDGKLLAFFASGSEPEWWDRMDHPHTGIPVAKKMDDDAEGRSATYEFKIPIEDIKDLLAEYHGLSWPDNYGEGGDWGAPKGIHRGNKQNGKYEEWHANGQKKEESYWEDESPRGTHRMWDDKGRLREVSPYDEDGHLHGTCEAYYDSGRLEESAEYNHGNILHREAYYRNGRLLDEASYEDDKENTWLWSRSYFEDGQLEANAYLGEDVLQHFIEYYPNGQKRSEETQDLDYNRVGYQMTWYDNGQLESRLHFNDREKQDGVQVRYYRDGRISDFWEKENGETNGASVEWDSDGTLRTYETYKGGERFGFEYSAGRYYDEDTRIPEEEGQRMLAERMAVVERKIAEANEAASQEESEARFSIDDTASTLGRNLGKEIDVTDEGGREQDRYTLDPETGKISLVSKNNRTAQDAERSILTALTQRGNLRETFGVEDYDDFLDDIYQHSGEETRREITDLAMGNGLDFRKATEQYLADAVARDDFDTNSPWWRTIKRDFQAMIGERGFNEITKRAGFGEEGGLSDNDLRYILWRNNRNDGANRGAMGVAEDVAMQDELGVGNYAPMEPEVRFSVGDEITGSERRAETISRLVDTMNTYRDDLEVRNNAMQGITDAFHAIQAQGKYDRATVQTLTDAINKMIQDDLLDPSRGDTKRILSAVKNGMDRSVGGNEIRFRDAIYSLGNVLADNQLRVSRAALDDALSVQTEKIGTDRIKKQGAVDGDTATVIRNLKKLLFGDNNPREYDGTRIYGKYSMEEMADMLEDDNSIISNPNRTEVERQQATLRATALRLAIDYDDKVEARRRERRELHKADEEYKDFLKKAVEDGTMTPDEARKERKEYDAILKDKLLQSKFDAGAALHDIAQEVINIKNKGVAKAKNFFEKNVQEKESETTALLNDLGGIASTAQKNTSLAHRIGNSAVAQLTAAPLLTYEQLFKAFGRNSADGQGWLYNKYVGGWYDAATKEAEGYQDSMDKLNAKAAELFGKGTRYTNLYDLTHKTSDFTLSFYDNGTPVERKLTIGNLLYVYMVDKMIDGQMKLRKMGINGDKVAKIKESLDPRLIELADWIQGEFLPKTRERYNETYKQLYGLSMDNIPNYVPLNILSNAVPKEDVLTGNITTENVGRLSTAASAIKTRSVNTMPIDLVNSDALSLIFDHVEDMEHWSAFAPLAKSLNMLLGDPAFRNRVMNMTTMYGAGETLLKAVENVCRQALGDYIPQRGSAIDKGLSKWGQAVASSKIAFRLNTALKQFISMANYIPDVNLVDFAKAMGQGVASVGGKNGTWQWAMENLPLFKKRWESRTSGDTRLALTNDDFEYWRKGWVERIRRWGITPNAFIDAVTVSVGAKAIYDTKYKQYIKDGYNEEQADKKAKQDAVLLYNQTQQSAEGAFISTMQSDRTVISMAATLFRNASMSYTRQVVQAARNLQRMAKTPKAEMVESMKGQYIQDGLTEEQAQAAAERRYSRALRQELTRLGVFAYIAPFLWRAGGHWLSSAARLLPALFGQNVPNADDERQQWIDDAMQSAWGPLEGMPFGNAVSDEIYSLVTEGKPSWKPFISYPLFDDIGNASEHWQNENAYQAINEIVNLGASLGLGASPQALEDAIGGMIDYCESEKTARDALILLSTLTSMPHSQINKLRLDEMDLSGEEALRLTPQEFVERYADAQKMHNAGPFTPLMGEKESEKYTKSATAKAKEQLSTVGGAELNKAYDAAMEQYSAMKDDVSTISNELKADEENLTKEEFDDKYGARVYDWLRKGRKRGKLTERREQVVEHVFNEKYGEGKYAKYKNVAVEDKKLNTAAGKAEKGKTKEETQALVKRWLNAKTPEEELDLRKQIEEGKRAFVEASNELNRED